MYVVARFRCTLCISFITIDFWYLCYKEAKKLSADLWWPVADVCKMFLLLKKTTTLSCYSFCKLWSSLATSCVCCSKIQLNLQNVSKDVQKVVSLKVKTNDFSFSFSDTWTNDYLVSTLQLINEKQNWSKWVDSVRAPVILNISFDQCVMLLYKTIPKTL